MLKIMSGMTRIDRIMNKYVRGSIDEAPLVNKMRQKTKMDCVCDEMRGNKCSKSCYKKER
jgi:hypothetical protein